MIESFRDAPPVQFLGPLSDEEANAPLSMRGLHPGQARSAMRGDGAMVGEFHELWWAANGIAFAAHADGRNLMDLRLVRLRMDTPGAIVNKVQSRGPDGGTVETVTCDWTRCREDLHAKGWLRLDPVIRSHGLSKHGLLPDDAQKQHEQAQQFLSESGPMCDPEFLADVGRCNQVTWNEPYRQRMGAQVKAGMSAFLSTLRESDDGRRERSDLLSKAGKASKKWRDAMAAAQTMMDGKGQDVDDLSADEPGSKGWEAIFNDHEYDRTTPEETRAMLDALTADTLRTAATSVKVAKTGSKAEIIDRLMGYLAEYKTKTTSA